MPRRADTPYLFVENVRAALLAWYDEAARALPWRAGPVERRAGRRPDPYRVWLSEIMLQQTTTAAVDPYYSAFIDRWPDVAALAAAPRDDVLQAWAGLGYYSRARNLHAAAQALAARLLAGAGYPDDEAGWRMLPGVGPYTAAAIVAIAFDRPANVVDGNVERVMARLFAIETPLPLGRSEIRAAAARFVSPDRPGDWAQSLMDLGATICIARAPRCGDCPIAGHCRACAGGAPASYPRKAARPERPVRHGVAFALAHEGRVLLVRRPDEGLLGGMRALPTTPWQELEWTRPQARRFAPAPDAEWREVGRVRHVFTHFALDLDVWIATVAKPPPGDWIAFADLDDAGLPTVFAKAAARASAALTVGGSDLPAPRSRRAARPAYRSRRD
jgi:A/G-specific adenine glycosylase